MSVVLEEVTIRYGAFTAVDRVTAEFPTGAVGLLGRNGAGKSSILKALLGLVRTEGGTMRILDLPQDAPALEIRRHVGYMPERDCYVPALNGYETVALAGRLTGLPVLDAARRAHEVLYLVGLDEQRYRLVSGYSTGMRQKVKLACALVHDPRVLFLDEPTNGLDPGGRVEMLDLIRTLARQLGKSVILSSHILQDVESTCAHVVLLEKGRCLASGKVSELTRTPVRVFHMEAVARREALERALRDAGVLELGVEEGGRLRLTVPESMTAREVFAAVAGANGSVRRLQEHRRSLEDVFLGAVHAAGGAR
ncbi:MAG: ABC transporter ATP-binding protein [Planctomycetes bacterium]|nr:ABC transporter ATP-binding protein [Planctomycetota bacterium]